MADKKHSFNILAVIILASALLVSIIPILETSFIKKLALLGLTTIALVKLYKFETQPIKIVTNEITADSGFILTDNGKTITGNMTQEELANYAIENNLTIEQIEEQLSKFSNRENLDYDYVLEEVKEDNEELFKRL